MKRSYDQHLNVFWQYNGNPHLEDNITRALINTLSLTNAIGIKNFYFQNNNSKDTISSNREFYHFDNYKTRITEMVDFSYTVVYFQRENGTICTADGRAGTECDSNAGRCFG